MALKIGLVTPAWPGTNTANGITTAVAYLANGLMSNGHDVTIFAKFIDAPHQDKNVIAINKRRWTIAEKLRSKLGDADVRHHIAAAQVSAAVNEAIRTRGVEVLVMEETHGWAGMVQAMVNIPVVVTLHGPWFLHKKLQSQSTPASDKRREAREARALQVCAGITAPSKNVLVATQIYFELPPVPQSVIANPMPLKEPVPLSTMDKNFGADPDNYLR